MGTLNSMFNSKYSKVLTIVLIDVYYPHSLQAPLHHLFQRILIKMLKEKCPLRI